LYPIGDSEQLIFGVGSKWTPAVF